MHWRRYRCCSRQNTCVKKCTKYNVVWLVYDMQHGTDRHGGAEAFVRKSRRKYRRFDGSLSQNRTCGSVDLAVVLVIVANTGHPSGVLIFYVELTLYRYYSVHYIRAKASPNA